MKTIPILVAAIGLIAGAGCGREEPDEKGAVVLEPGVNSLLAKDLTTGTGTEATRGRTVVVHYTGWLYDPTKPDGRGTKFDSSLDGNEPFSFTLGSGDVIKGWDHGVEGMKVGGRRLLTIPPNMAYGPRGAGGVIPPNATLLFEVQLLDVR